MHNPFAGMGVNDTTSAGGIVEFGSRKTWKHWKWIYYSVNKTNFRHAQNIIISFSFVFFCFFAEPKQ